ncbi:hypothetical protein CANCADRAFT_101697 [Tortispora caseinolytica NRRL Y-17796]|uniref:DNA-directed RNA polymerase subunit n=1 Tax=Tortispora caseinolytica NRRL Y-17796 TaxID=767744 RepID=A0A1E4TEG9_9ASCO|nr:hypothetical protein CANCADRAFT_101697 [Tortispora caseinolytica NRRL Y-17796]
MFWLSRISDIIRIAPTELQRHTLEALEDEINKKFSNKVLLDTGLCICLYDIESIQDGMLRPGDAGIYVNVEFRMIVFRPFIGEVLVGWISSCTSEGIKVRMHFFDDIWIPKQFLFSDCSFVPKEQAWVWRPEGQELYLDNNEKIRFRIEQEIFSETGPARPDNAEGFVTPPYSLVASCQSEGMGLVSWWDD